MGKVKELFAGIRQQIEYKEENYLIELFEGIRDNLNLICDLTVEDEINPLTIGRQMLFTQNCIENNREKIRSKEMDEADKYIPEQLKEMKIQYSGGGYTYDYKLIKIWADKKKELLLIEESAKAAFLASQNNKILFLENTGEVIELPKVTPRKQSITYK